MTSDEDEDAARAHVHGFHAYPARMHPTLARRCVELMAPAGGVVLDPFCGSGTVLVESMIAGRPSHGADLNPLAVRLTRLKTTVVDGVAVREVMALAKRIAAHAEERRKARRGATRRYPEQDVQMFDPHVLLELDGLRSGLEVQEEGFAREALWLVLSAILIKVSRRAGDTSASEAPKRLAAGYTISLFERKAGELARRLSDLAALVRQAPPRASVTRGDARQLKSFSDASVDLVVTSPPYAGTYDYMEQHAARLRWLGMSGRDLMRTEIGARRDLRKVGYEEAVSRFTQDMTNVMKALHRVLRADGRAVVVIADSVVARQPVWADPLIRQCAKDAGLRWLATASQPRPHFHGPTRQAFKRRPRHEHAILLVR